MKKTFSKVLIGCMLLLPLSSTFATLEGDNYKKDLLKYKNGAKYVNGIDSKLENISLSEKKYNLIIKKIEELKIKKKNDDNIVSILNYLQYKLEEKFSNYNSASLSTDKDNIEKELLFLQKDLLNLLESKTLEEDINLAGEIKVDLFADFQNDKVLSSYLRLDDYIYQKKGTDFKTSGKVTTKVLLDGKEDNLNWDFDIIKKGDLFYKFDADYSIQNMPAVYKQQLDQLKQSSDKYIKVINHNSGDVNELTELYDKVKELKEKGKTNSFFKVIKQDGNKYTLGLSQYGCNVAKEAKKVFDPFYGNTCSDSQLNRINKNLDLVYEKTKNGDSVFTYTDKALNIILKGYVKNNGYSFKLTSTDKNDKSFVYLSLGYDDNKKLIKSNINIKILDGYMGKIFDSNITYENEKINGTTNFYQNNTNILAIKHTGIKNDKVFSLNNKLTGKFDLLSGRINLQNKETANLNIQIKEGFSTLKFDYKNTKGNPIIDLKASKIMENKNTDGLEIIAPSDDNVILFDNTDTELYYQNFITGLQADYAYIKGVSSDTKNIKNAYTIDGKTIKFLNDKYLFGLKYFENNLDDVRFYQKFDLLNLPNIESTPKGTFRFDFATTSTFENSKSDFINLKIIGIDNAYDFGYIEKGWDLDKNGYILFTFESNEKAKEVKDKYFKDGVIKNSTIVIPFIKK